MCLFGDWDYDGFLPLVGQATKVQKVPERSGENPTQLSGALFEPPASNPVRASGLVWVDSVQDGHQLFINRGLHGGS